VEKKLDLWRNDLTYDYHGLIMSNLMEAKSIRTFIGAKDFDTSRAFYRRLGFTEVVLHPKLSLFKVDARLAFYLQDYYVKDWVENSMIFLEVDYLDDLLESFRAMVLPDTFPGVRLSKVYITDWGREFFLHDPAGVLWHFGHFAS
jgi:catechol 2,3-dioxygenase-like lactoylglutathione lyase family enzyme